jgi:hypothetical protein
MDEYVYIVVKHDDEFGVMVMAIYNNEASAVRHLAYADDWRYRYFRSTVKSEYEEN